MTTTKDYIAGFIIVFSFLITASIAYYYYKWQEIQKMDTQREALIIREDIEIKEPSVVNTSSQGNTQRRLPSTNRRSIYRCINNVTGSITLKQTCFANEKAELIEPPETVRNRSQPISTQTKPNSNRTQQGGQIIIITNYRQEIKKCDDYYEPHIKHITDINGYMFNEYLKNELDNVRNRRNKCYDAANKGKAIIY